VSAPVWDEGEAPFFPVLDGVAEAELCVVGLGGSGLSAVVEALGEGRSVVGIDAGSVGGGAAGRNGGFLLAGLAPFHHDLARQVGGDRATELYRLTQAELERIAGQTPGCVRLTGSLRIAASEEELLDCAVQFGEMREDGLPVEEYAGPEGDGLLFPGDGTLQPLARCRELARQAAGAGALLFEGTPGIEILGHVVTTPRGRVECDSVVAAVDGRLEAVLPELAESRGVRTARAQMLATAPLLRTRFSRPVYTRWGWDYFQQLGDGRLVLGGFRDRGGEAEWTHDPDSNAEVQGHLEQFLRNDLEVEEAITHRWAGLISFTEDRLPVLNEVRPRVWACGAYSGTGNVVGALCGRLAARLALGLDAPEAELLA
jgi:gamma-glutamylputrescine oxidase